MAENWHLANRWRVSSRLAAATRAFKFGISVPLIPSHLEMASVKRLRTGIVSKRTLKLSPSSPQV